MKSNCELDKMYLISSALSWGLAYIFMRYATKFYFKINKWQPCKSHL